MAKAGKKDTSPESDWIPPGYIDAPALARECGEAWWPLAVAVAWVLLRSRQAVEQLLDRHPRKPVTFRAVDICAAFLKAGGQHTTLELENSEAAFRELRYHLETGEIEVLGTWFVREGNLEGSARTKMGEQEPIPYTKISSLRYFDDHEDPCLIPRDRHAAHGSSPRTNLCGYRDVQVRSAALVRVFPDEEREGEAKEEAERLHAVRLLLLRLLLLRKEAKEAASVASPSKKTGKHAQTVSTVRAMIDLVDKGHTVSKAARQVVGRSFTANVERAYYRHQKNIRREMALAQRMTANITSKVSVNIESVSGRSAHSVKNVSPGKKLKPERTKKT